MAVQDEPPESHDEEQDGLVGLTWDGELVPETPLRSAAKLDWHTYQELIEELGCGRDLVVSYGHQTLTIDIQPGDGLVEVLHQIPTVIVLSLEDERNDGPGGGQGHQVFIAPGVTEDELIQSMFGLATAINKDTQLLLAENRS